MPLIQKIASFLWLHDRGKVAATYSVGTLRNSRIRAVAHYGKAGFEVSWQVVPGGDGPPRDDATTARLPRPKLVHALLERAARG